MSLPTRSDTEDTRPWAPMRLWGREQMAGSVSGWEPGHGGGQCGPGAVPSLPRTAEGTEALGRQLSPRPRSSPCCCREPQALAGLGQSSAGPTPQAGA